MVASSIVLALALAGIYSLAKVVALLIALRGTKPSERAQLISALSELFPRTRCRACHAGHRPARVPIAAA